MYERDRERTDQNEGNQRNEQDKAPVVLDISSLHLAYTEQSKEKFKGIKVYFLYLYIYIIYK